MNTPKFTKFISIDDFTEESQPIIKDYNCPLCQGIYYNPVIDACGHIFCEQCYTQNYEKKHLCPVDKIPLDATPTKVRPVSLVLEKQTLKCKNRVYGCEWNGPLKDFESHIDNDCARQSVICSWVGCNVYVFREDLPSHNQSCDYRIIECPDCHIQLPFIELKNHQEICPKFKLPCKQDCGEMIERENIDSHIQDTCLNTIIPCPYSKYGCNDTVIKRNLLSFLGECRFKHEALMMELVDKLLDRIDVIEHLVNNTINKTPKTEESHSSPLNCGKRRRVEEPVVKEVVNVNLCDDSQCNSKGTTTPIVIDDSVMPETCAYDMIHCPKEVIVSGSKAKCFSNPKKEHRYLFSNDNIDYNDKGTISSWTVRTMQKECWIGFGICDKDQVIENRMKFYSQSQGFSNGTFLISMNSYSWNCNVKEEDNHNVEGMICDQEEIYFTYNPMEKELSYQVGNFKGKLTQVYPKKGDKLTPCIVFLDAGGSVQYKGNVEKLIVLK